jgi:glucokinase
MTELVADIGGTGSRLAIMQAGQVNECREYVNAEFSHFPDVLGDFLAKSKYFPNRAALAVAGPVADGRVHMTNLGWDLDSAGIATEFGFDELLMVNDFVAQAWATDRLLAKDLHQVGGGPARSDGNRVIVGPGTGLGVSALVTDGSVWTAVPGEGGHISMAAANQLEADLIENVRAEFGHCSAERLISGAGLSTIYRHLSGKSCRPEEITNAALRDEKQAQQTLEIFACLLGSVAADLALVFGAHGGVYLGGGILPAILKTFIHSGFRQRFEAKGRYRSYLERIPCWVITAKNPAFLGLDELLRRTPGGKT